MRGPWIGAAGALAVAAAVSGCGGRAVATPAPVPTPILSGTAQLRLPITSYELSDTQSAEAEYLGQLYTQECMHGFGFEYLSGLSISSIAENRRITVELNSRRYGVSDSGGPDQSALVQQIASQGFARAQADPRVRAVDARWTACMRSYGHAYATPFQAANHWNLNAPVSTTEIQTAGHDIACKRQVNLIGVEFAVESDYENAGIARNAQALANDRTEIAADAAGLRRLMANVKDQAAAG